MCVTSTQNTKHISICDAENKEITNYLWKYSKMLKKLTLDNGYMGDQCFVLFKFFCT